MRCWNGSIAWLVLQTIGFDMHLLPFRTMALGFPLFNSVGNEEGIGI